MGDSKTAQVRSDRIRELRGEAEQLLSKSNPRWEPEAGPDETVEAARIYRQGQWSDLQGGLKNVDRHIADYEWRREALDAEPTTTSDLYSALDNSPGAQIESALTEIKRRAGLLFEEFDPETDGLAEVYAASERVKNLTWRVHSVERVQDGDVSTVTMTFKVAQDVGIQGGASENAAGWAFIAPDPKQHEVDRWVDALRADEVTLVSVDRQMSSGMPRLVLQLRHN